MLSCNEIKLSFSTLLNNGCAELVFQLSVGVGYVQFFFDIDIYDDTLRDKVNEKIQHKYGQN